MFFFNTIYISCLFLVQLHVRDMPQLPRKPSFFNKFANN